MSAPSAPRIVPRPTSRNGLLRFFWSPPLSDGDGSGISSYTFSCSNPSISRSFPPYINREDITGLTNGTPYSFDIYATNSNGFSGPSATFLTRTPCDFPGNPSNISTTVIPGKLAVFVQWSTPTNTGGSPLDHNAIYLYPTDSNSNILSNFSTGLNLKVYTYGSSNSRLFYYPSPFYNYKFIVRSINDAGWSGDDPSLYIFLSTQSINPATFGQLSLWLDSSFDPSIAQNINNITSFSNRADSLGTPFNSSPSNKFLPSISSFSTTNLNNLQTILFSNFSTAITQATTFSSVKHVFFVARQGPYNSGGANFTSLFGHETFSDWHGGNSSYFDTNASSNIAYAPSRFFVNGTAPYSKIWTTNIPFAPLNRPFILNIDPVAEPTRFQGLGFDRSFSSLRAWNGNFAELLVFTSSMTTSQISSVNSYLINKWFPSPSNFSPSSISSCLFWIDTSKPNGFTMSGSNVTTIRDFSRFANNLTLLPSGGFTNPLFGSSINGLSTVRTGSGRALRVNSTINGTRHLFWVGRQASNAEQPFLLGSDSDYAWHPNSPWLITGYYPDVYNGSGIIYNKNTDFSYVPNINNALRVPNNNSIFMLHISTAGPNTPFQGITYDRNIWPRGWTGDLGEVICFSSTLSSQQLEEVEGYLKRKWAIFPQPVASPNQIGSLQLWLDASDPFANGTVPPQSTILDVWFDKSGLNRHASANSNLNRWIQSPFGGRPSIQFVNNSFMTGTISPTYTSRTWYTFVVFSGNNSSGSYARVLSFGVSGSDDYNNNSYFAFLRNGGDNIQLYRNGQSLSEGFVYPAATSIPNAALIVGAFTSSNAQYRLNGITLQETTATPFVQNLNLSAYRLGRNINSNDVNDLNGFISEVIVYSNITQDQIESVEAYLKQKYNL